MSARPLPRLLARTYVAPPAEGAATAGSATWATAQRLLADVMERRFSTGSPRSVEYQDGVRAVLEHRALGLALVLPYTVGTAQADAWFAGVEEGHALWRQQAAQAAEPAATHPSRRPA